MIYFGTQSSPGLENNPRKALNTDLSRVEGEQMLVDFHVAFRTVFTLMCEWKPRNALLTGNHPYVEANKIRNFPDDMSGRCF